MEEVKRKPGFQKGHGAFKGTEKTQFKKGQKSWNFGTKAKKKCLNCSIDFPISPSQFERSKFCSVKCKSAFSPFSKVKVPCPECGKLIQKRSKLCRSCANSGEKHPEYKGDEVGYSGLHWWIRRHFGKAFFCSNKPNEHAGRKYEWANISGEYKRDISDWQQLCHSCNLKDGIRIPSRLKEGGDVYELHK